MTHADRDRSELQAYLAADKADYPRTWKGDGYARAEAAEAKVAELTTSRQALIDHNRQLIRERREAMDRAEAAERALADEENEHADTREAWASEVGQLQHALADERAKVAPLTDESVLYDWVAAAFAGNGTVHFDSDAMDEDELWVRHVARSLARRTRAALAGPVRRGSMDQRARSLARLCTCAEASCDDPNELNWCGFNAMNPIWDDAKGEWVVGPGGVGFCSGCGGLSKACCADEGCCLACQESGGGTHERGLVPEASRGAGDA